MAERATRRTFVESPYGAAHGADRVERVVDTIDGMHRRKQIDDRQKMAADRYRWAYQTCPGSIRSALDQSGRGGGIPGGMTPSERQIHAATVLRRAAEVLGKLDGNVVARIVGEGQSIDEASRMSIGARHDQRVHERDRKHVGRRLREALTALADDWFPEPNRIRSFQEEGSVPQMERGGALSFEPSKVAHATATTVYGMDDKPKNSE